MITNHALRSNVISKRHSMDRQVSLLKRLSASVATLICMGLCVAMPVNAEQRQSSSDQTTSNIASTDIASIGKTVTKSRILLEKLLMSYHLARSESNTSGIKIKIQGTTNLIRRELDLINTQLDRYYLEQEKENLNKSWADFIETLNTNVAALTKSGKAPNSKEMIARSTFLDNTLLFTYNVLKSRTNTPTNQNAEAARSLSRLLQHIASRYAAKTADSQNNQNASTQNIAQISRLTKQFKQQLSLILENSSNNTEIKEKLERVELKWRYIEKSLSEEGSGSISFLVTHYSDDMVSQLLDVATLYERS